MFPVAIVKSVVVEPGILVFSSKEGCTPTDDVRFLMVEESGVSLEERRVGLPGS